MTTKAPGMQFHRLVKGATNHIINSCVLLQHNYNAQSYPEPTFSNLTLRRPPGQGLSFCLVVVPHELAPSP